MPLRFAAVVAVPLVFSAALARAQPATAEPPMMTTEPAATIRLWEAAAPGALWLAALFAGVLAFNRSYQVELDGGALEPLLMYPGARRSIFAGKLLANFVFVFLLLVIVIAVSLVLFHITVPSTWPRLLLVVLLGEVGLVTLGTFYAAMASRSRAREVLLPLLLFPMLVPVLLAAMQATKALLVGDVMHDAGAWTSLLVAYDVIFLISTFLAFDYVIEA